MAVETLKKRAAGVSLEYGMDSEGNLITKDMAFQYISKDGYTAERLIAVAAALGPCIIKTIHSGYSTATYTVTAQ